MNIMDVPAATLLYQIALAAVLGLLLIKLLTRRPAKHPFPPSPPAHWLWGHAAALAEHDKEGHAPSTLWKQWADQLGPIFKMDFKVLQVSLITDAAAAKEVMAVRNYHKSPTYQNLVPFLGAQSMVLTEGEQWSHIRKAFNPAFSYGALKQMVPMFQQQAQILADLLEQEASDPGATDGYAISMVQHFILLTMDVIFKAALGHDSKFLSTRPLPKLYESYMLLVNEAAQHMGNPMLRYSIYLPWCWLHMRSLKARVLSHLQPMIEACKAAAAAADTGGYSSSSSSSPVANAIITQALQTAAASGHPLDDATCASQVSTMIFAGHDTTAATMSWVVYELTQHPHVEAKLVSELREVLGDKWDSRAPGDQPTADQLVHMQYLNAVIKETMRLWPIGGTARWGPHGAVLNGFDVSRQMLYVDPYILHRNEAVWGPDASEFKPERWLDDPVTNRLHPFAYQPFSKGPRDCIGQQLALLEMRAVLAELYRRFTFSYAGAQPERIVYKVTNKPRFGVMVRVHMRGSG